MYDLINIAITCTSADDLCQGSDLYVIAVGHAFEYREKGDNSTVENLNIILDGFVKMLFICKYT